jgi:hypothetical protein
VFDPEKGDNTLTMFPEGPHDEIELKSMILAIVRQPNGAVDDFCNKLIKKSFFFDE